MALSISKTQLAYVGIWSVWHMSGSGVCGVLLPGKGRRAKRRPGQQRAKLHEEGF